ncbi:hypothetical protein [Sphingobacterium multivorum]|uniref:hypothetical protein n=1 Tax=Sphingobacterium multivorum TaxID=28454 RepID=UPI0028AC337F|nr:hypothetical protein [Sphingobacterium multivorum]
MTRIKTYIINLEERFERRQHILGEFKNRDEFDIKLIPAIKDSIGSWGLWLTVHKIVENANQENHPYIIICEDDHSFTDAYNKISFLNMIDSIHKYQPALLIGGASWFDVALPVKENLFWLNQFNGFQFTIIFKKFYDTILNLEFEKGRAIDYEFSSLSDRNFVLFPFISIQKEFGYSDVTKRNGDEGYISRIFGRSSVKLNQLSTIARYYKI